jgi:hypothetical protein
MSFGNVRAWSRRGYFARQQTVAQHRASRIRFYQWRRSLTDRSQRARTKGRANVVVRESFHKPLQCMSCRDSFPHNIQIKVSCSSKTDCSVKGKRVIVTRALRFWYCSLVSPAQC